MHFAAGPWFTVLEDDEWTELGTVWLADGFTNEIAHVQYRVQLLDGPSQTLAEVTHE